jgi:hypothetical protein
MKHIAFSWGYWGWESHTREFVRAVDAVERSRGMRPPVFADVRFSRSVRAVGFRDPHSRKWSVQADTAGSGSLAIRASELVQAVSGSPIRPAPKTSARRAKNCANSAVRRGDLIAPGRNYPNGW